MKAFPDNTEIETSATFVADNPGALVMGVTPDPRMMTMRIHHSFLRAPTGYTPREADPRIGVSAVRFQDYSKPFSESPEESWITRWRLEKKDPSAPLSDPIKPITIYFDPAIPAPIRHAMKEDCCGGTSPMRRRASAMRSSRSTRRPTWTRWTSAMPMSCGSTATSAASRPAAPTAIRAPAK